MNAGKLATGLMLVAAIVAAVAILLKKNAVIRAVFRRNVLSYFSGVLGYLFIVVFVELGAFFAFRDQFFANNLCNLDQLTVWFPWLLLFIVPAITMSAWADEKKLGTDELLFTLPARDIEVLLGKYLAVLAVYTVALAFSVTHMFVLGWIGRPDVGLLFATFFGYWIAGAALLSAGMFASVLTSSTTVAFVLGAVICAIPVGIGTFGHWTQFIRSLSVPEQLLEFGSGLIPFSGLAYFVSFAVFMLYLNIVFITRRHWSAGQRGNMGSQFAIRSVALAAILISVNVVTAYASRSLDMTAENLFSLSPTTRDLIQQIRKQDGAITIQAFLSPEAPREYVPVSKGLTGLLRQFDQLGGENINVQFIDVEPFSEEASQAKLFGIESRQVQTERGGKSFVEAIYLGVVITGPRDEVVIPFFDVGIPIEYELTRSIRTASLDQERKVVGILNTDARLMGGFDFQSMQRSPQWRIVTELKKQYKVEEVSPDGPIDGTKYDVVIAVLPSSLTQPQMENFVNYVKQGKPALVFDDPMPVAAGGLSVAPRQPKPRPGGGFQQGPPPEQKADGGNATTLVNALDIAWDNGQVVWASYNPHPEFASLPPEYVFISPDSGSPNAFSPDSPITSGLQEIVLFFPGTFRPRENSKLHFERLLLTGPKSGIHEWNDIVESGGFFGGISLKEDRLYVQDKYAHLIAAHITSKKSDSSGDGDDNDKVDKDKKDKKDKIDKEAASGGGHKLNVIYVSDADIVSDQLFALRESGLRRTRDSASLQFDNVTFVLNSVDVLANDDSLVELRKRRPSHRTLQRVEDRTQQSIKRQFEAQEQADKDADEKLEQARKRLRDAVDKIKNDEKLDPRQKAMMIKMAEENEQRQFEVAEANIQREKRERVEQINAQTQREIRREELFFRNVAIFVPPLPAILLGFYFLTARLSGERREIAPERRISRD